MRSEISRRRLLRVARASLRQSRAHGCTSEMRNKCVTLNGECPRNDFPLPRSSALSIPLPHPSLFLEYYLVIAWIICRAITGCGCELARLISGRVASPLRVFTRRVLVIAVFFFRILRKYRTMLPFSVPYAFVATIRRDFRAPRRNVKEERKEARCRRREPAERRPRYSRDGRDEEIIFLR